MQKSKALSGKRLRPADPKTQITECLTEEREEDRVVVRHDEEVDAGESGAGLQVAKGLTQVILFPTAANKHLQTFGKVKRHKTEKHRDIYYLGSYA